MKSIQTNTSSRYSFDVFFSQLSISKLWDEFVFARAQQLEITMHDFTQTDIAVHLNLSDGFTHEGFFSKRITLNMV